MKGMEWDSIATNSNRNGDGNSDDAPIMNVLPPRVPPESFDCSTSTSSGGVEEPFVEEEVAARAIATGNASHDENQRSSRQTKLSDFFFDLEEEVAAARQDSKLVDALRSSERSSTNNRRVSFHAHAHTHVFESPTNPDFESMSMNEDSKSDYSHTGSGGGGRRASQQRKRAMVLAQEETRWVVRLRIIMVSVMVLTSIVVSWGVYQFTKQSQETEFQVQFEANALKIVDLFLASMERRLASLSTLSSTITSYAMQQAQDEHNNGTAFPFVTIPDFETRASDIKSLSNLLVLFYLPLVTEETRQDFEEYAKTHRQWVYESAEADYQLRRQQDQEFGLTKVNDTLKIQLDPNESAFPTTIHHPFQPTGDEPVPPGNGPYLPIWQMSPVTPSTQTFFFLANFLLEPDTSPGLRSVLKDEKAVLDRTLFPNPVVLESLDMFVQLGQYRHQVESHLGDPLCFMTYPVFDSFLQQSRKLTGIVTSNLYWRFAFMNILPPTARGYICVLESSFNQTFTYRLDGHHVTFLGPGDLHDPRFDDDSSLQVNADVNAFLQERDDPSTRSYTTVPFNMEYSRYTMRIYPSVDTQADFVNNMPIYYTMVVVAIFVFASALFVVYDCLVERRQSVVMDRAIKSHAIVDTLFPQVVQDRLYSAGQGNHQQQQQQNNRTTTTTEAKAAAAAKKAERRRDSQQQPQMGVGIEGRPIADLFPDTSVLFADIAGFTKWSSSREPVQVFQLLEAIYSDFDAKAEKRNVFKVETIGDCYLAVTGLPEPQPDHAVIMVRFARDVIDSMTRLAHQLSSTLGQETEELAMRVGLHSGPVTAGVLRGKKSRFQLFGDTVNTAARMESNGIKNKIHVSQSTANELMTRGRGHWLTTREDKVVAKGKGEMVTYWVTIRPNKQRRGSGGGGGGGAIITKTESALSAEC